LRLATDGGAVLMRLDRQPLARGKSEVPLAKSSFDELADRACAQGMRRRPSAKCNAPVHVANLARLRPTKLRQW
jgi:hypothetical protein